MKKLEKNTFWFLYAGVFVSGLAFIYLKYLYKPSGNEFGIISNPYQAFAHKGHLLFAMFWMLVLGFIFASHVVPKLKIKQKKALKSGWMNIVLLLYVSISGYLIQLLLHEDLLSFAQWSHIIIGCVSIVPLAVHYFKGRQ